MASERARLRSLNGRDVPAAQAPGAAAADGAGGGAGGGAGAVDAKGDVADGLAGTVKFVPLLHDTQLRTAEDIRKAVLNNGEEDKNWCFLCRWTEKASPDVQPSAQLISRLEELGTKYYGSLTDYEWAKNIQDEFNTVFRPSMPLNDKGRQPWWSLAAIKEHFVVHVQNAEVIMQHQKRIVAELIQHAQCTTVLQEDEKGEKQMNSAGVNNLLRLMSWQLKLFNPKVK